MAFETLFQKYDRLLLIDTETTGLDYARDEIIELSAVVVEQVGGMPQVTREYDQLIQLSPGGFIPEKIVELTGITNEAVRAQGISKEQAAADAAEMIRGNTLILAYNAHFDLSFLFYFLMRHGDASVLKGKDKLDLLTVFRDRHDFPHKLCNAIDTYGLAGKVVNSHRAIDDVIATVAVMEAMEQEKNDLIHYVNLVGYNPKYGIGGKPIGSVTYKPQGYKIVKPLYET